MSQPETSAGTEATAHAQFRAERQSIEVRRTRQFLVAQTTILAIAAVAVTGGNLSGTLNDLVFYQSITFTAVVGLLTAAGWWFFRRNAVTRPLVVALLNVDSLLGLVFFYVAGEFETPAMGLLATCVVMAHVFAGGRHAWGIAAWQIALYALLLLARQYDLLPYGYMLPAEAVKSVPYVVDCFVNFNIATLAVAYLAGRVSIDILNSQQQLEEQVVGKTRELASANAELAGTNAELRRTNGRLGEFNVAVSHDLRGPLQSLVAQAELLAMKLDATAPEQAREAEAIADLAQAMGVRIDELLRLSRAGDRIESPVEVALDDVVARAVAALAVSIERAGGEVRVEGSLGRALGNGALLVEAVQNLLENGLKYGSSGGPPAVLVSSAPASAGRVALAVEDAGAGIPAERRSEVFALFRRLAAHRHIPGVGAGLTIVQRIVEAHGGSVRVEDARVLSGARIVVELPAA